MAAARACTYVGVTIAHVGSRQRRTRLRQPIRTRRWPNGASCSRCSRRPCAVARTPQPWQPSTCRSASIVQRRAPLSCKLSRQDTHPRHAEHHRGRRVTLTTDPSREALESLD